MRTAGPDTAPLSPGDSGTPAGPLQAFAQGSASELKKILELTAVQDYLASRISYLRFRSRDQRRPPTSAIDPRAVERKIAPALYALTDELHLR
jgi:hypothetical protein